MHRPSTAAVVVAFAAAAWTLVSGGCTRDRLEVYAPPSTPSAQTAKRLADVDIADAVARVIASDPAVGDTPVQIMVGEGIVEIVGEVPTLRARERLTELAEGVRGVRAVSNRAAVRESHGSDAVIADDVREALRLNRVTELFDVVPWVDDGVARLDGFAHSWVEKQVANDVVEGVAGVQDIDDHIVVIPSPRPDEAIANDVRGALHWDALVRDAQVDVKVEDGVVTLSGFVGSARERSRAVELAHAEGVARVNADDLEVHWWASPRELRDAAAATDIEVQNAIITVMQRDPRIRNYPIQARVDDGAVTLDGVVDTLRAARIAEELAESTLGVRRVDNTIVIRPTARVSDAELRDLVEVALTLDPVTSVDDIDVDVHDGRVTLTGVADDLYERAEAEDLAMGTRGVVEVDNELDVESIERVYLAPRSFGDGHPVTPITLTLPDRANVAHRTDAEIESAIEQELTWNARLAAYSIEVEVDDGRATLTGEVDNIMNLREAEVIALSAGAASVENRLRLVDSVLSELD